MLVPLDGSNPTDRAVAAIIELAHSRHAQVLLVRVVEPAPSDRTRGSRYTLVNRMAARMTEALESMAPIAAQLRARGLYVVSHVRQGVPAPEMLAAAREANVDFVAMTTHGPDGAGTLVDPVAESALRRAGVPVVIVPAAGRMLEVRPVRDGKLEVRADVA
jgi:nucleotide-binding universal stress UspA family protein